MEPSTDTNEEYIVPCTACGAPAVDLVALQVPMFLRYYTPLCEGCTFTRSYLDVLVERGLIPLHALTAQDRQHLDKVRKH